MSTHTVLPRFVRVLVQGMPGAVLATGLALRAGAYAEVLVRTGL
jgi:hypothetical protein